MDNTEEAPRISPNLVPDSLETHPPSPALLNTSRPPQTDQVRVKPPTRTYGKRVVAVEEGKEGGGEVVKSKSLERQSTVVVPETDPDHDDEESEERDVTIRGRTTTNSSSPPKSDPRSTSPTSTEGEDPVEERVKPTNNLLANLSGESSDEEVGEKGGNAIDFYKKHGNIEDQLKAVDQEWDERQDSPPRPAKITAPPTSSSLPTLTDSDPLSRNDSYSQPTPSNRLHQSPSIVILDPVGEDESPDVLAPTARSRKARARIVDSDDEEEEEAIVRPRQVSAAPRKSVIPTSSDNEGDVASSPVRRESSAPGPSKQERLHALVAKRQATMPRPVSPPRREANLSDIEDESNDEGVFKKKKPKKSLSKPKIKALSKKNEDEMHKQSAAFAREQETRLEPVVKKKINVFDTLRTTNHRQSSLAPPAPRRAPTTDNIVVLSSSDSIISASSPRTKSSQISRPSAKALGKQRAHSPIDLDNDSTPRQRRSMTVPRPETWGKLKVQEPVKRASSSDSEEDLLSIEEMEARKQRKEEEKKAQLAEAAAKEEERLMKRKLREKMLRDARAKAAAEDDDDSDLEIEGRPTLSSHRRVAATPQPGTELDHVMRDFARVDPSHHYTSDDDPTDSQVKAAGKEFGHHLGPNHHFVPSPAANRGAKRRPASKAHQPVSITQDSLSRMLVEKAQRQAIESRLEKMSNSRKQQLEQGEAPAKSGPERLDVRGMLEKKKEQQQEQKEEDDVLEEMDDPDYQAGFDEEEEEEEAQMSEQGDEDGSGSDVPVPKKGAAQDLEEGDFDSEGELVMPVSSQNSDRHGQREVTRRVEDDEDDDEDAPIARRTTTVKPRVVFEEDEEEEGASPDKFLVPTVPATAVAPTADVAPAPVRMMLDDFGGGDDGGGFSQFFDSQFDQNAPGAFEGEGFGRAPEPTAFNPAPTMAVLQPLISTAERLEDAARLEARGAVHNIEPGTPREAAVPRQYINKQGFMTQTRPVNMFGDSPAFSPRDSQVFQESLSTTRGDSQSQHFTQTQVDATPTQAVRHPNQLRRQNALVRDDSLSDAQPDPTEIVEEESFPSAAQPPTAAAPPRDAFSALRQGAALASIPEKTTTKPRREKNAFVDDQANLDSDEEQIGGLNAASGDEDEEGHDAELDELVDNQAISEELQAVQDARARELHQEELDKREAADLKRAQNIADGKERNKRKGYELDDDDFDDEFMANERREKKARIDNMTTTELLANEKTRAFAQQLQTTCVAQHKAGDLDMFEPSQRSDDERDEDDEDLIEETQEEDVFGGVRVKVNTTYSSVRAEAVRKQRELEELQLNSDDLETQMEIHLGNSSSPVVAFKTNNRIHAAASKSALPQPRRTDNYDEIESQYSFGKTDSIHSLVNYKGDSRDDSQTGNGVAAGGRSAVTSFKKGPLKSTSSLSSTSLGGGGSGKNKSNSRTALGPKSSKFSSIRKGSGGFAS